MARVTKNQAPHHQCTVQGDNGGTLLVIGRAGYLWVGPQENTIGGTVYTFSGRKTLLKLAKAIQKTFA